jgi:hypothetical protein
MTSGGDDRHNEGPMAIQRRRAVERAGTGTLSDVITTILDKGLVIDIYARVSVVGIELTTVEARIVVSSVDTHLRFADAVNRVEIGGSEPAGLPELMEKAQESGAKAKTRGVLDAVGEKAEEIVESIGAERIADPDRQR